MSDPRSQPFCSQYFATSSSFVQPALPEAYQEDNNMQPHVSPSVAALRTQCTCWAYLILRTPATNTAFTYAATLYRIGSTTRPIMRCAYNA